MTRIASSDMNANDDESFYERLEPFIGAALDQQRPFIRDALSAGFEHGNATITPHLKDNKWW